MTETVNVSCMVVPDGVVIAGANATLRVSLVLTPVSDGAGFDIEEWPKKVSDRTFHFKFHSRGAGGAVATQLDRGPFRDPAFSVDPQDATRLWATIFSGQFQELTSCLRPAESPSGSNAVVLGDDEFNARHVRPVYTDTVAELIGDSLRDEMSASLLVTALRREPSLAESVLQSLAGDKSADVRTALTRRLQRPGDRGVRIKAWQERHHIFASKVKSDSERFATNAVDAQNPAGDGARDSSDVSPLQNRLIAIAQAVAAVRRGAPRTSGAAELLHTIRSGAPPPPPPPAAAGGAGGATAQIASLLMLGPRRTRLDDDEAIAGAELADAPDPMVQPRDDAPDYEPPTPTSELVARKLAGLDAYPTVRKYLRLLADVKIDIPLADLTGPLGQHNGRIYGYLSAGTDAAAAAAAVPTAFVLDTALELFEPCTEAEMGDPSLGDVTSPGQATTVEEQLAPYHRGLVALRATTGRFRLQTIDSTAGRMTFKSAATGTLEALRNGARESAIETAMPDMRTRGLCLLDRGAHAAMTVNLAVTAAALQQPGPRPYYAENLLAGYRVDIIHDRATDPAIFSATDRDVIHADIWTAYGRTMPPDDCLTEPVLPWHPFDEFRDRDEGFVGAMVRTRKELDANDHEVTRLFPSQEIFAWNGDPMSVPSAPSATARPIAEQIAEDLPVRARLQLPAPVQGRDRRCPAFRIGRPVRVLLRVRKPNGASISLAKVQACGLVDSFALGEGTSEERDPSFVLTRSERTQAPEVLIRRRDLDEVDDDYFARPENLQPGDAPDTLILRSDEYQPRPGVDRVLLAPRCSFTTAEQESLFDDATEDGASPLRGVYLAVNLTADADFRRVRRPPDGTPEGMPYGMAFVTQGSWSGSRSNPYFVDPGSKYLGAALRRGDVPVADASADVARLAFWNGQPTDGTVKPLLLRIAGPAEGQSPMSVDTTRISDGAGGIDDCPRLTIRLAPAEEYELDLWAFTDLKEAYNGRTVFRAAARPLLKMIGDLGSQLGIAGTRDIDGAIAALDELDAAIRQRGNRRSGAPAQLSAAAASLSDEWRALAASRPVPGHTSTKTLTLLHAVSRPLGPPPELIEPALIRLDDDHASRWAEHLGTQSNWKSDPGGRHLFVRGKIRFHRKSTDQIRCEAAWVDHRLEAASALPDSSKPTPADYGPVGSGPWRYAPTIMPVPLFDRIENIPRRDEETPASADILDLEKDDSGALRGLVGKIDDGKAHRIAIRLVATSRFTKYFETDPANFEARHSLASATLDDIRQAAEMPWAASGSGVHRMWIEATERPKPLEKIAPTYVFPVQQSRPAPTIVEAVYRPLIRLDLGREWFTSGDGELLAVVCKPANLVDALDAASDPANPARLARRGPMLSDGEARRRPALNTLGPEALDQSGWLSGVVTRWGNDPIRQPTGLRPYVMPPDAFSGYVAKVPDVVLPKSASPGSASRTGNGEGAEKVAVLAYQPMWDSRTGTWFVEIDVETFETMGPMIRFGVARFQPHALHPDEHRPDLPDLRLSEAMAVAEIEAPSAWRVRLERSVDRLQVVVKGDNFNGRAPMLLGVPGLTAEQFGRTQRPNLRFELGRVPVAGSSSLPEYVEGSKLEVIVSESVQGPDGASWSHVFPLTPTSGRQAVVISEIKQEVDHGVMVGERRGDPFVTLRRPFDLTLEI